MLSFLSPLFLAGAAAAAVPIVLHLLKRDPEPRLKFPAVQLLKRAPVEMTDRRRLRELLLLALRVAALVLLALAFARPFFASGAALGSSGATIVAVDTSYSLSAPGQMERAKRLARQAIDTAPAGDLVGVVRFDDTAEPIAAPGADRALARAAIDRLSAGYGGTRYRAGLDAAAQMLSGRRGRIVVVTDLQESGWDAGDRAAVPESARIEIADVGAVRENLAVTAATADGDRVTATVRNTGTHARTTRVHLTVDGRAAGETETTVPAGGSSDIVLTGAARGASAAVSVDDADGMQADNVRYVALAGAHGPSVVVVTDHGDLDRDAFYVEQALTAGGTDAAVFRLEGVSGAALSGWNAARLASRSAVLLLSTRGLERRGREALAAYVQAGGGMLIAAGPEVDGAVAADVLGARAPLTIVAPPDARLEPRALAPVDVRHPVFRPFESAAATLGLVTFRFVARVGGDDCQTIARFTTGEPALVDCPAGEGRALVLASDLNDQWNDFPLHATFVPFLHEAVRYLAGARPRAGEYLVGEVPAGVPPVPGVVPVPRGAAGERLAVNVDPRESDPARLSPADFQAAVQRLKDAGAVVARADARTQEDRQHLWQYVLVAMIGLLAVEGLVASRTA
ncbi:MAG: BatA domain-containing protein [Betaproteobacteria bacterium]